MKNPLQKGFTHLHFLRSNRSGVGAQRKSGAGFTLVELLIVIALLGALAIGLIGAIDPFEQLKKGQDTGTRNTVSEIHSAVIRFFALKGRMPWCTTEACSDTLPSSTPLNSTPMSEAVSRIIDTGELKSNFTTIQSSQLGKVFVTGTAEDAKVCYRPVSKSFRSDDNTKYARDGSDGSGCGTTDATACYWCVQ